MQQKYEAMFLIKPDLTKDQRTSLLNQVNDTITKNHGKISASNIWQEKRPLAFEIHKFKEAAYYLVNFEIESEAVAHLKSAYKLMENILRLMITKQ